MKNPVMKLGISYSICLILFFAAMYGVGRIVDQTNPKINQVKESKFNEDCKYYVVRSSVGIKYLIRCKNRAQVFMEDQLTKEEINEFEKRYSDLIESGNLHISD